MTTTPSTEDGRSDVRRMLGEVPWDLLAVVLAAVAVEGVVLTGGLGGSTLRALVGFVFVLIVPGYAVVSALFPARPRGEIDEPAAPVAYSPGTAERLGLSFGVSLAVVPMLAIGHGLLGLPFEPGAIGATVTALVVVGGVVAAGRRLALSPIDRYHPPSLVESSVRVRDWLARGGAVDTLLTAALTVAVLLAVGSVAYGLTAPHAGDSYSSVSLVTANDSADGEFVASNYPTNFTAGEGRDLTLRVENHHDEETAYTAVGQLQRVSGEGSGGLTVEERERIARSQASVGANETWTYQHTVRPTVTGDRLRLIYYVYEGDAPAKPTGSEADYSTHIWVTVT